MSYAIHIPTIGGPDVLTKTPTTLPSPKAGEVVIRNTATAVNFIDTIIRRGEMPPGMMPDLPHIPGVEGTGTIAAIGEGVEELSVGERVIWMGGLGAGGYGTHATVPAHGVVRIADTVSDETAAALPVNAMTAWHMLVNLGRVQAGDWVLVHGAAGGVGTMILQLATHLGVRTIASVSTHKMAYATEHGADVVVDYKTEDLAARVAEATGGRGINLSLNPVSGSSVADDLAMLAPFGTIVLYGFLGGPPEGSFAEDLAAHFIKSVSVRVSDIYTLFTTAPERFQTDLCHLADLAEKGVLAPHTETLPLSDAHQAHRRLESGQVIGKLVLKID